MAVGRRDQILATAAQMFADRGFHAVSVDELGAAVGVSGPALYRHFASKDAMLAEMLVDISERLLGEGRPRVASAQSPRQALEALVGWHIEFALGNPELITVQLRDWAALSPQARERVRKLQGQYVEEWVEALMAARPELDEATARASVHAAFGLLNSTPHSARIDQPAMHALLERMAMAALLSPGPD
jgi:AcrR family transcriptional regulator